jgi:hypothetical protein
MKRRKLLNGILVAAGMQVLTALPSFAATYVEQVVSQLQAQGFEAIEVERTLLGRTRIAAVRADGSREIVLNPNTGEILRDLWTSKSGDAAGQINIGGDEGENGNTGPGGGDSGGGGEGEGGEGGSGHSGGGEGGDD